MFRKQLIEEVTKPTNIYIVKWRSCVVYKLVGSVW